MTRQPAILRGAAPTAEDASWFSRFQGMDLGTNVTILSFATEGIGEGPPLHVHDYDEIIIVREGTARFTIGAQTIDARAGDILFGPATVPHRFETTGEGRFESTAIHLSDRFAMTEL